MDVVGDGANTGYSRIVSAVVALVRDGDGRVLLASTSAEGPWSCLGGTVEDGEDPAVAAVRISREDCGVLIEVTAVVAELSGDQYRILYECGQDTTYRATVYDVRIVAGPGPDALMMTSWFAPDEFQDLKLDEFASVALADLGLT